jgi:predicted glutamine amidotransferase
MGRLLGIVGAPPLGARQVLMDFYALAEPEHLQGWGMSGFNNGRAVYFGRSATSALANPALYETAVQKCEKSNSSTIMAHFRKGSGDPCDITQVHPFHHRDWVFGHDGALARPGDLMIVDTVPQGQTDSERLLHWLVERMIPADDATAALIEGIQELKEKMEFTALTFLLTDGLRMWAYRESKDKNTTLFWAEEKGKNLICSEPMAPVARWKDVPQKKLFVFDPAQVVPQLLAV